MAPAPEPPATRGRRIVIASIAADLGGVAIAVAGFFAVSAGLVVIAAVVGMITGRIIRGADARPRERAIDAVFAAVLAVIGVIVGQVLLWVGATAEGGALGPIDYLAQTFGFLVPLQLVAAAVVAWLAAR